MADVRSDIHTTLNVISFCWYTASWNLVDRKRGCEGRCCLRN